MNAQQLKNAILQEAIEGRLVPQDPNDEPASILLERIRAEKERLVKEGKLKKKDLEVKPISEDEIPFEIPASWEWLRIGTIITYQNGYAYNSSEMNKEGKGVPVIKSGNLMTLEVVLKPNNDYVEHPNNKMLASKIVKGDMLMCLSSQSDNPEPLGKTAIYKFDTDALLNQRVLKFRPYDDQFTPFLFYTINSFYFWYNVSHQGGGSAQANLKLNHVLDMPIPFPPLAEQKRIVAKIEELLPKIEKYGKAQDELNKLNEELPERLKKSILQEAIEGRLVSQDPNDEPASVLLQKIREEKQQLVKEGKLKKKDLEVKPISEDEIPFEIPKGWVWVRFGTITINRDSERIPLSVDERSRLEKKYDYYGASGVIDKVDRYLFNKPLLLIGEDGANLINRSTPIAFIAKGEYWVNNHAHVLDYLNEDLMQYMCWYINAISLVDYVTGTAQPKMNQEKMNSIPVALPPLAEQKRIVAKIEELLQKIDGLKK